MAVLTALELELTVFPRLLNCLSTFVEDVSRDVVAIDIPDCFSDKPASRGDVVWEGAREETADLKPVREVSFTKELLLDIETDDDP